MKTIVRTLAAAGAAALLSTSLNPASAAVISNRHFVDEGSESFGFCPGMAVEHSWRDRVHELVRTTGPHGLVRFSANVHGRSVFTNLDTGGTYSNTYQFTDHDLKVVDNGDGTLTITAHNSGSFKWIDTDGHVVLKGSGQFRFRFSVYHMGTPTDPTDDVDVPDSFVVLKDTGRDQTAGRDFCEDLVLFT